MHKHFALSPLKSFTPTRITVASSPAGSRLQITAEEFHPISTAQLQRILEGRNPFKSQSSSSLLCCTRRGRYEVESDTPLSTEISAWKKNKVRDPLHA